MNKRILASAALLLTAGLASAVTTIDSRVFVSGTDPYGPAEIVVTQYNAIYSDFNPSSLSLSNDISGLGEIIATAGNGYITLTGGSISVARLATGSGATLQIGDGVKTGINLTSSTIEVQGTVIFNTPDTIDYAGTLTRWKSVQETTQRLVQTGMGTLRLSGTADFDGPIELRHGTLEVAGANALGTSGDIIFSGGALRHTVANTTDYSARFAASGNGNYAIDTNGQSVTFASGLRNAPGETATINGVTETVTPATALYKSGLGTLTLAAENTYGGGTVVTGGTLIAAHEKALGAGPVTVSGGITNAATLTLQKSVSVGAVTLSGGIIDGPGTLTATALQLDNGTVAAAITGSGKVTVGHATSLWPLVTRAIISDTGSLASVNTISGGTLTLTGGSTTTATTGTIALDGTVIAPVGSASVATVVTLSGNNTYTGGTEIINGELIVTSPSALGTGPVKVSSTRTTLAYLSSESLAPVSLLAPWDAWYTPESYQKYYSPNAAAFPYPASIIEKPKGSDPMYSGGGFGSVITVSGGLVIDGFNLATTYSILTVNTDITGIGTLTLDGGLIRGTGSIDAAAFDLRAGKVAVVLTGAGALTKSGSGELTLSATNHYTGGTTIESGTLFATATGAIPGAVSLRGGLLVLNAPRAATGDIDITWGGLNLNTENAATGNISIRGGGSLSLNAASAATGDITASNGTIDANVTGAAPGRITLTYGTLNLNATGAATGSVAIADGTLNIAAPGALAGTLDFTGGTLRLSAAQAMDAVPTIERGALVVAADNTLTTANIGAQGRLIATAGTTTIKSGAIAGNVRVDRGATLTLAGATMAQTYFGHPGNLLDTPAGESTVSTSVLVVYGTLNLGAGAHQLGLVAGTGTIHIARDSTLSTIYSKDFTGTWLFEAGATTRGTPTFNGNFTNNGRLAPGNSPGIVTITGDFINGPAGIIDIEIGGATPGTQHDVIRYSGQAQLNGGTLNLTFINGYTPAAGTVFRFLEDTDTTLGSPSVVGAFTTVNFPTDYYGQLIADDSGMYLALASTLAGVGVTFHDGLAAADQATANNPTLRAALASALSGGAARAADALRNVSPIGLTAMPGLAIEAAADDHRAITDRAAQHRALAGGAAGSWEAYAGGSAQSADSREKTNSPTFDSTLQRGYAGLEKALGRGLTIGITPAYAVGKADMLGGGGDVSMNRASLTAYTAYGTESTTVQLGVRGAHAEYDTKRRHLLGTDKGSASGYDFGGFVAISHVLTLGKCTVAPEFSLGYTHADIDGFHESGSAGALAVSGIAHDSLRARLASSFDWTVVNAAKSSLAIGLAVGAEEELLDHDAEVRAAYAGGNRFTTDSAAYAETSVDVGPQLTWRFGETNTVRAGYRYAYGFDDTTAQRVDVSYSKRF